ncbi:uncharacterized protein Dwil_GK16484 [Drosophila willistoni]|uniref:Uncharacterized protein n=1 Tax=Drosophila willistoni TaxID=7260 RepID=B4N2D9_DROWI|nr:uncharacterized protein Dwil_GK16484 [Drosophila willistoni]
MACPPGHDLVNTPEHLRPGFRGQPRQYDPSEFGLTGREEWRHPRMFRDMTYDTDAAAMETFRQANQPRRQAYDLPAAPNLSNLPEECLADVSMPSDQFTPECQDDASPQQQQPCDTSLPASGTEGKNYVDSIYEEIVSRFNSLRERLARGDQMTGNETDKCGDKSTSRNPLSSGVQTKRRKVITTHCDPCGSVTSQIEETSTVLNDQQHLDDVQPPSFFNATDMGAQPLDCTPMTSNPPYASPPGRRLNFNLSDQSENLDQITMPSFRDDTLPPAMSTRIGQQRFATDECLADVSAPSFVYSDSPQSGNATFQDICDITPPYFIETNKCLTDMTLPTFSNRPQMSSMQCEYRLDDVSAPSFNRSMSRGAGYSCRQQNVSDMSAPSLASSGRGVTADHECLQDMSIPSFAGVSGAYRSRGRSPRKSEAFSTPSSFGRGQTYNDCLEDMSMPSFGDISEVSRGRNCQESMPSQNIGEISAPSFGSTGRGPVSNECLDEVTMPSFGGVSGASRGRTLQRQQMSMPSQNICDVSAPSFGSSGHVPVSNDCLEDMSVPSFGGVSGASRGRSLQRRQVSMPSQNICDVSAPSFGSSGRGPASNDCIEDMTMPSFGGVSGASRGRSLQRRQVSTPSQNICDVSAPSFGSSGRGPVSNDCLEDMTIPSFGGVSGASRGRSLQRRQDISAPCFPDSVHRTIPTECLEDMSMPSMGVSQGISRRQATLPSQCLEDISAPSFARSTSRDPSRPTTFANTSRERNTAVPSFGGVSGSTMKRSQQRQQMEMPSLNIGEISAPSFNSSGRSDPVANECLEDQTMPSFGGISGASRARYSRREQASMPTQNIRDISAPSFGSPGRGHATASECLDEVTMPSFGASSNNSRRQVTLPSECLNEVSAPTFARSMSHAASYRRGRRVLPCSTNEQLDDMSMPTFRDLSSVNSGRRPNGEPSFAPGVAAASETDCECVDDVTPPSFAQTVTHNQQKSMPSTNTRDISAPSFRDSGRNPMTYECLDDMPTPSFNEISGASRARSPRRQANISNRSGPFRRPQYNECLEDMSMPSFGGISGASRSRAPQQRQQGQSMPSQNICDMTAPSFGSSSREPMIDECLNDMTMPSFGNVSGAPRKQVTLPSERLDNVTAPSFARSIPLRGTSQLRRRPRTFASSTRNARDPMPSECIEGMSEPSFAGVSGAGQSNGQGRRVQQPMPSRDICDESAPSYLSSRRGPPTNECLDEMTMPSFGGVSGASQGRRQRRWQRSMPSQNICDESAPSYLSSRRGLDTNECLDEMTMPSFGEVSGAPQGGRPGRSQRSMPSQNICDESAPSYFSSRRGSDTKECLNEMTMPSFGGVSGAPQDGRQGRSQRSMPSQNICDESAPSYLSSRRGPATNECLDEMTMPSFGGVSGAPQGGRQGRSQRSMPSQNICDESAPSFLSSRRGPETNECLDEMTMPSFGGVSGAPQGRGQGRWQRSIPSQNICDESAPSSFYSSRRGPVTNECLENMTAPSFGGVSGAGCGQRNTSRSRGPVNPSSQRIQRSASVPTPILASTRIADECLENVTMPSFGGVTSEFNERQTANERSYDMSRLRRQRSMPANLPSECLDDVSAPNLEMSIGGRRPKIPKGAPITNECLEDVSMPSLQRNQSFPCLSMTQQQQQISDISAPSMATSSVPAQSQAVRTFPSEQIENISAPFDRSEGSNNCECGSPKERYDNRTWTDNTNSSRLEDVTMPSYEDISYSPRRHQLTMPNEDLEDITEPAKGRSRSSLRRIDSVMPNEQLEDISQPDFYTSSSRTDNRMASRPENLEDITMPSMAADVTSKSSASIHHASSEQKVTRRLVKQSPSDQLADESAPSMLNDQTVVTVKTSSSVTRIYIRPTDSNGLQNIPIPSLPGQNGGPAVGYLVQGPDQQLITITYDGDNSSPNNMPSYHQSQDGLQSAHSTGVMFIKDVTEPSYAPSYEPTHENVYENMQGNGEATNDTYHGFGSMQNYAPFDELIRSPRTGRNSPGQGNDELLQTPQPVRTANRETARRSPGSPCQMVNTSYPYGRPRCITRRPC